MSNFLYCIICFLISGKLGFGGGRVLLPVFLLSSKHWVNMGYSDAHMNHILKDSFEGNAFYGLVAFSISLCWGLLGRFINAGTLPDLAFDLLTKILTDG